MEEIKKGRPSGGTAYQQTRFHSNHAFLLLSRLDRVRETGPGRWIARCPGHDDRSPSLSIREADDGRVLLHCFAGCSVESVVQAVGLELSDLFPRIAHHVPRQRRAFDPAGVLACVAQEALIVQLAAEDVMKGKALNAQDLDRLAVAAHRIDAAAKLARGAL